MLPFAASLSLEKLLQTLYCRSNPSKRNKKYQQLNWSKQQNSHYNQPDDSPRHITIIQIKHKHEHDDESGNINAEEGKYERIIFSKNLTVEEEQT